MAHGIRIVMVTLAVVAGSSVAFDTITIQPRGWGPVHCHLTTNHTTWAEQLPAEVDFWMRGQRSGLRYGCRFHQTDNERKRILAQSWDLSRKENPTWIEQLAEAFGRRDRSHKPEDITTSQPFFTCTLPTDDGAGTALLSTVLPVRTRRSVSGFDAQWQGCHFKWARFYSFQRLYGDLITVSFRGGSPTIVCGVVYTINRSITYRVSLVNISGIVNPAYECFFVTYLDFIGIVNPPRQEVFKKTIEEKWGATDTSRNFPPYSCWSSAEENDQLFDFEVLVNGEFGRRCRFSGGCPECTDNTSTPDPTTSYSHNVNSLSDILVGKTSPTYASPESAYSSAVSS